MKQYLLVAAAALAASCSASAQTLQQAETLWKQGRFFEANNVFRELVAKNPDSAEDRIRWGRLYIDYGQPSDAKGLFEEALKIKPRDPAALVGLALCANAEYSGEAATIARQALDADPNFVEAQEILAIFAMEDNNTKAAEEEAHKALTLDPKAVQARAVLAVIDWLADKKDTQWDPHDARGYELAGHLFMLNRRYDECIEFYRKALALDPNRFPARSEMGINLMRIGKQEEAYKELSFCHDNGFKNASTNNSLLLLETLRKFETFERPGFELLMDKKEAGILEPYFESEMKRTMADYEAKYRYKVPGNIRIEVYPNHEDFAVRTVGMPGFGALGVTFDTTVAMDSPSGRTPGSFHWASTLRHEMSHVYTLSMTNSHIPRWFTEGIAVHEETASSPEWGDRLGPDEINAIKSGKLLPIDQLDRGFLHPKYPQQVIVSYFQGGKTVDFITEKWGWDTVLAMINDFKTMTDTAAVVRKELKVEPAEFDKQFLDYVDRQTHTAVANLDKWKEGMKHVMELAKAKDNAGVIREALPLRDLYPDYVEEGSAYELLAHAYFDQGDKTNGIDELERYVKQGGRNPESIKLLAKELDAAGQKKEAADILDRLNYIYPLDDDLHKRLGELSIAQNRPQVAIREFKVELAGKVIDAAQAHYDLAQAYNEAKQPDKAKDECFAALEVAPNFKPAQKLLLQLSGDESAAPVIKK